MILYLGIYQRMVMVARNDRERAVRSGDKIPQPRKKAGMAIADTIQTVYFRSRIVFNWNRVRGIGGVFIILQRSSPEIKTIAQQYQSYLVGIGRGKFGPLKQSAKFAIRVEMLDIRATADGKMQIAEEDKPLDARAEVTNSLRACLQ